jgi:hypothetical protein
VGDTVGRSVGSLVGLLVGLGVGLVVGISVARFLDSDLNFWQRQTMHGVLGTVVIRGFINARISVGAEKKKTEGLTRKLRADGSRADGNKYK